jgi:hypothetical protein
MGIDQRATQDFERAASRAFWRRIVTRLTGENNELLPFDEVREKLTFRGQHYIGLKQVPINQIVGSMGRFNDFDREFLPTQTRTKGRWISIDKAHYEDINLPPVDLYKIGEIYFVKDGNHRVSVARDRGQEYMDAYVTEIDIPVMLTPGTTLDELDLKQEQSEFILETELGRFRPDANVEASVLGVYPKLLEHIRTHRYYLGIQKGTEVSFEESVTSWYDNVYLPLVEIIRENGLEKSFPGTTEAELYLWIMEYIGYLRQIQEVGLENQSSAKAEAARHLMGDFQNPVVRDLVQEANRSTWIRDWIMQEDRANFITQTRIDVLRPQANIETTLLGQYETLKEHITVHRWYLGEYRKKEASYDDAVTSWYDYVYLPIVEMIREQKILDEFPGRTETDLYLWIIRHQWFLRENYGSEVSIEEAVVQLTDQFSVKGFKKFLSTVKKAIGLS